MDVKTVVRCYFKTFGDFVTIYSTEVSRDGIFVNSDTPLHAGDSVRLEFKLRNDYPLIMGVGQVASSSAAGAHIKFVELDADSEKFLNEVVKVKAAELKTVPGAPQVTYDAEVVQEESTEDSFELDDAFAGIQDAAEEIEDVDTGAFEEVDTGSFGNVDEDIFADNTTPEAAATGTEDIDFSGLKLGGQTEQAVEDPFGDSDANDPADESDIFAESKQIAGGQQDFEQEEVASGYEEVEQQSPSNTQALFEDIQDDGAVAAAGAVNIPADEITSGGTTTVFARVSALKERRALLIGAAIGLAALVTGGAAWFFMAGDSEDAAPAVSALVQPAPVARQAPQPAAVAPVTVATASIAPSESSVTAPVQVESAPAPVPTPAPPPEPAKAAPVAVPAPAAEPVKAAIVTKAAPPQSKPSAVASNSGPATKVLEVEVLGDGSVQILGNGAFQKVKHFTMTEPNRIIVDLYGVSKAFKGLNRNGTGAIARIRPGEHAGKIRFVLDLKNETGKIPAYDLTNDGQGVTVRPGR